MHFGFPLRITVISNNERPLPRSPAAATCQTAMASTTTGNSAVQVSPVHRARCGSSGASDAGHASLRAFAAAHAASSNAVFGAPAPLGAPAPRRAADAPEPAAAEKTIPIFVFGESSSKPAASRLRSPNAAALAIAPHAGLATGRARLEPTHGASETVFGPAAPQMKCEILATGSPAPKRPREVHDLDDVVSLLGMLATSGNGEDDVDVAAKRLRSASLPERPPVADSAAANTLFSCENDRIIPGPSAPPTSDSRTSMEQEVENEEAQSHLSDLSELSFLVTRCDIDPQARHEHMPYIT